MRFSTPPDAPRDTDALPGADNAVDSAADNAADTAAPRPRSGRRRADMRPSTRSAFGFIAALGPTRNTGAHTAAIPVITPSMAAAARSTATGARTLPTASAAATPAAPAASPRPAGTPAASPRPAAASTAPAPTGSRIGKRRHQVTLAVAGISFGLVASLTSALPSYAAHAEAVNKVESARASVTAPTHQSVAQVQRAALKSAIAAAAQKGDVQKLDVSATVAAPTLETATFSAVDVAANLEKTYGISASYAQQLIGTSDPNGRAAIIATALTYLGDPYVLGGASHSGIDCSGLTMVAYAAAGVSLAHYVPDQDAVGTVISQAAARPGDLVVFDDEDHVGIYMGDGMVLHAPTEGRDVELDPLSDWSGIAYHFTQII